MNKFVQIENKLKVLSNKDDDQDLSKELKDFLSAICELLNISSSNPEYHLFSEQTSDSQKKTIAAWILRAICSKPSIFEGSKQSQIRTKVFKFTLDPVFSDEIYRSQKISRELNYSEKISKLADIEKSIVQRFEQNIDKWVDIQSCSKIKDEAQKLIFGSAETRFLLFQLSDTRYLNDRVIRSLLSDLEEYYSASIDGDLDRLISKYEILLDQFPKIIDDLKENSSDLTHSCLGFLFEKLFSIIQKDFASREELQETTLEARVQHRKYPFHEKDRNFKIKIFVHNSGKGGAFESSVTVEYEDTLVRLDKDTINAGYLEPGSTTDLFFEGITLSKLQKGDDTVSQEENIVIVKVEWKDYKGTIKNMELDPITLDPQNSDLDWEKVSKKQPYSLEAVSEESELFGRKELLLKISRKLENQRIESIIISGQKRVGKTSVAKTIESKFIEESSYIPIYLSIGELDKSTISDFLNTLGQYIYEAVYDEVIAPNELLRANPRFSELTFDGSIYPLVSFFKGLHRMCKEQKFLIIIDEFDEIPRELCFGTSSGDTFFHNMRALSQQGNVSFVLVGGENMELIKESTDRLNKFESFLVDYLGKDMYWNDFQDLVKSPVKGILEFPDAAIEEIYTTTEGNPFFTKFVCSKIFEKACETHTSYISSDDISEAISACLKSLDINNVNHFWKDGISESDNSKIDKIQTQRREFLRAYAGIFRTRKDNVFTKDNLIELEYLDSSVSDKLFESFVSRKILVEDGRGYRCKPDLFNRWLVESGYKKLRRSLLDEQAVEERKQKEVEAYVSDTEIYDVCSSWKSYKGKQVGLIEVRTWLNQFSDNINQRLMFKTLQALSFYDQSLILEKCELIHRHVLRNLTHPSGARKVNFVLVSAFSDIGKSGPVYARLYAQENKIYKDQIISACDIKKTLEKDENNNIKAIVFIDDIISSGTTVIEGLESLNESCGEILNKKGIKVVPSAVCGLEQGLKKVEDVSEKYKFQVSPFVADILRPENQCFSAESKVFEDENEMHKAKKIAQNLGEKKIPLGYNDDQLLIVFYEACPNNTLSILWHSQKGWKPLFPRK
jgi:hypothetical protein